MSEEKRLLDELMALLREVSRTSSGSIPPEVAFDGPHLKRWKRIEERYKKLSRTRPN